MHRFALKYAFEVQSSLFKSGTQAIVKMDATKWTQEAVAKRRVKYQDLRPCTTAFIDTRTPGSDQKENFTIIGPGVA